MYLDIHLNYTEIYFGDPSAEHPVSTELEMSQAFDSRSSMGKTAVLDGRPNHRANLAIPNVQRPPSVYVFLFLVKKIIMMGRWDLETDDVSWIIKTRLVELAKGRKMEIEIFCSTANAAKQIEISETSEIYLY